MWWFARNLAYLPLMGFLFWGGMRLFDSVAVGVALAAVIPTAIEAAIVFRKKRHA
jgi:hypothetical protein